MQHTRSLGGLTEGLIYFLLSINGSAGCLAWEELKLSELDPVKCCIDGRNLKEGDHALSDRETH